MTERRDWLIVALSESPRGELSPVQIQKAMFLFKEGAQNYFAEEQFYDFSPYHFGPFDPDIYYDLEALEKRGLVQIERSETGKRRAYVLTAQGKDYSAQIKSETRRASAYLGNITRWVAKKSFPELLRYIYRRWPQYRVNSIFVDHL
jgi:hypothetical protein